jgi:hypothetical protein
LRFVTRPGLAKTRGRPLLQARRKLVVRTFETTWRELFSKADVVSEGSVRVEPDGRVWYGSTSLILATPESDAAVLVTLAGRDVHFRLRALRMAHREASLRAPSRLGRLSGEIRVGFCNGAVRIDVDVQAPLIEGRTHLRRVPLTTTRT